MTKCIDCGREFDPQNPAASLVRGPVCHQKSLSSWKIPDEVEVIAEVLKSKKHQVYLVGGSVRDFLMGRKIKDYDLVTDAKTAELEKMFPNSLEVGKQFGIVKVPIPGDIVEIATFREDGSYTDGRRPDSVSEGTMESDVQRRDFTVNGLLYNINSHEVIDQVGGMEDMKNRVIRCIGNASERFQEDYLRMLRALRFATVLDFSLEKSTFEAVKSNSSHLTKISKERIIAEISKIFDNPNFIKKTQLFAESKILNYSFETISDEEHTKILEKISRQTSPVNRQLVYSWYFKNDVKLMNGKYRITLEDSKIAQKYYEVENNLVNFNNLSTAVKNKTLMEDCVETSIAHTDSSYIDEIKKELKFLKAHPIDMSLLTSGKELIEYGATPGTTMGEIMKELNDLVFSRKIVSSKEKHDFLAKRVNS